MDNPVIHIDSLENVTWVNGSECDFEINSATDVWQVDITLAIADIDSHWHLLSEEEQEKGNRYHLENDKQRFVVSRACLRTLLGKYSGLNPDDIIFETGENQKPTFKNRPGIHYNLSHSGNYVLIAISANVVGVDVEKINTNVHFRDIMGISFSPAETNYVNDAEKPLEMFYKLWTRKEAILKAIGTGINDTIISIPGINGKHDVEPGMFGAENNWLVNSFMIDEKHVGTVAYANKTIHFFTYS